MPHASLRIAVASTQTGWRGGEVQAAALALGLSERGHQVVVMAPGDSPLRHRLAAVGVATRDLSAPSSPLTLARLRQFLRKFRPHVVHFNDSRALTTVGAAAAGLPIAARIASRRVDYRLRCPSAYRLFADRLACVSQAVRERCLESGLDASMLHVVPDGVDPELWPGAPSTSPPRRQRALLAVGALISDKGHGHLLGALALVRDRYPDVVLDIAGDGPERDALRARANGLGFNGEVRLLGQRDDVVALMHGAAVLVHPSVSEGLSTVLIESMLAGLPIVASRTGGIQELLAPARGAPLARLCPPADSEALANAINAALEQPVENSHMAARARARAAERYTQRQMVERTLAVYRAAIRPGPA